MINRRDFLKASSAALAALAWPSNALASKIAYKPNTGLIRPSDEPLKLEVLEDWLNQLSISRKVLLYEDLSKIDSSPRYELDTPVRRNRRRKRPLLACSVDGEQLRHHAPPYLNLPINTLSIPAKMECQHTDPEHCEEFRLASLLAAEETKRLVWMCQHGAKRKRYRCPLTTAVIDTVFKQIEQWDCVVEHLIVSPVGLEIIRDLKEDILDEPSQRMDEQTVLNYVPEWHLTKGHIWCSNVLQTAFLKPNQFMAFGLSETVGPLVQQKAPYITNGNICVDVGHALVNPYLCMFVEVMPR